jgi:hypothetical protein
VSTNVVDTDRSKLGTRPPRPDRAVFRMLELADAAAARGDYADALDWLARVDASGDRLDPLYEGWRREWRSKVESRRVGSSQWFG